MIAGLVGIALVGIATRWPKMCRYTLAHAREAVLALGVDLDREKFSLHDLKVGMNVEREHFDVTKCKPILSARIALAHLRERPDYYVRLKKYVDGIGTIPPFPAGDPDSEIHWLKTTYRRGTIVRLHRGPRRGPAGTCFWHRDTNDKKVSVGDGWRGEIDEVQEEESGYPVFVVKILDARDASGYQQSDAIGRRLFVDYYCMEALTDNWTSTPKGMRRYQLPASQKKRYKGRVSGLGTVPPPPDAATGAGRYGASPIVDWSKRTFVPGTRVRWKTEEPGSIMEPGYDVIIEVPMGRIVTSVAVHESNVEFRFPDVKEWGGSRVGTFTGGIHHEKLAALVKHGKIEVIDDNWGPLVVPSKKKYGADWVQKKPRYKGRP